MSRLAALAGAAAVIAVGLGIFAVGLPRSAGVGGIGAAPTPSPTPIRSPAPASPSPALAPALDTSSYQPFSSTRYGYTLGYPAGWTATPGAYDWSWDRDRTEWNGDAPDRFYGNGQAIDVLVTGFSVDVGPTTSLDAWMAGYLSPSGYGGNVDKGGQPCTVLDPAPIVIDGHPGRIVTTDCSDSEAFVLVDGRMYVFSEWRGTERPVLEAILSTVHIGGVARVAPTPPGRSTPSVAPASASTARPIDTSGWTPYDSSRYGFTIGVPPGWTVAAADHDWTWNGDATNWLSTAADRFTAPGNTIEVSAWTVPLPAGQTFDTWGDVEAWAQTYCERTGNTACATIRDRVVPMCIENRDCHPALVVPFGADVQAFGTGGVLPEGMLVVALWRGESDPSTAIYGGSQRLLDGFLSTLGVVPPAYPESQAAAASFAAGR